MRSLSIFFVFVGTVFTLAGIFIFAKLQNWGQIHQERVSLVESGKIPPLEGTITRKTYASEQGGLNYRIVISLGDSGTEIIRSPSKSVWEGLDEGEKISVYRLLGDEYHIPATDTGGFEKVKWYFPIFGISMLLLGIAMRFFHLRDSNGSSYASAEE